MRNIYLSYTIYHPSYSSDKKCSYRFIRGAWSERFEGGKFWETRMQYLVNILNFLYNLMIKGITKSLNIFTIKNVFFVIL